MNPKLLIRRFGSELLYRTGLLKVFADKSQNWRILMYHRITSPSIEGYPLQAGMYVTPKSFKMQMEFVASNYQLLDLDDLIAKILNKESFDKPTVAITFDDGWKDNYNLAYPILRDLGIPATVFLATEYINTDKTFWSDALPYSIAKLREDKPDTERIKNLALVHELENSLLDFYLACLSCKENSLDEKIESLILALKNISAETRESFSQAMLAEAGGKLHRSFLNWEEVREMSRNSITFGSHTHRHLPLDELSKAQIEREILDSKEQLNSNQASLAGTFCYPEGKYSKTSQEVLAEKGIMASLATESISDLSSKPALVGRVGVHEDISNYLGMFVARVWL